jgi:hypothetical protein
MELALIVGSSEIVKLYINNNLISVYLKQL